MSQHLMCHAATMGTLPRPSIIELQHDLLCAFCLFFHYLVSVLVLQKNSFKGDSLNRIMVSGNFHKYKCIYSSHGFKLLNYIPFFRLLSCI